MPNADFIADIDHALHLVELLAESEEATSMLRFRLRNLKRLILICGRDEGWGSTLARIEDIVSRNAEQIRICLGGEPDRRLLLKAATVFHKEIICFFTDFNGWYRLRQRSATPASVLEIIRYVAEALVDVRSVSQYLKGFELYLDSFHYPKFRLNVDTLEEQLKFMETLISFSGDVDVGAIHDLWDRAKSFAIFVARHLFSSDPRSLNSSFLRSELELVYETYTRALGRLKLQRSLMWEDDDVFIVMQNIVDFLIYNLRDLPRYSTQNPILDLQRLYAGLQSLSTALRKKQQQLSSLSMEIKEGFGDAVCDAGVFICSLNQTLRRGVDVGIPNNLLTAIDHILAATEPDVPVERLEEVEVERLPPTNDVVGFNDAEGVIVNQLTRGSDKLQIIAIVGMPGLGKTTLATKVYNNPSISHHFRVRACCCVSQTVDKRKILLSLLNQIGHTCRSQIFSEEDLADLAEALWRRLKRRRYLIFLDDMWDLEAWNLLHESFPDDAAGSRIIFTSRQHDVAPPNLMVDGKPYFLRQLNEKESFELLQRECSFGLSVDLGIKVVEKCKGLPLMIVIVAGVLNHAEPEGRDELLDRLSSASIMEQCRNSLELSYMQLPVHLKPCLLYFGIFLENQEVSVRRLLRLWIAEGFIQNDDMNSPEDYFKGLVSRSLIMVDKQRSLGGAKTCRVHNLIRDFCLEKAKDEGLFHLVRGYEELAAFHEPLDLERLCIHSEAIHFRQSKLFCPSPRSLIINSSESMQTLIGGTERRGMSHGFRIFKRLKVLDLEHVHFGDKFPSEIEHLVQLTFLAILCEADAIPQWIGNLSSLETFIKPGDRNGRLPDSLWHLKELQHLHLGGGNGYYTFSEENLDSPNTLHKLDSISGVVIHYSNMESLLRKFPNIRKLKCRLQYTIADCNLVFPNILSQIQSLSLLRETDWFFPVSVHKLSFPENLKKLTLGGFSLSSGNMSTIGVLPNLEVLKLLRIRFAGGTWLMKEREFSMLKILKMVDLGLTSWSSDEDAEQLPLQWLEKLVLENISQLKEMPRCLENIDPLEVIVVSDCHYSVLDLVEHIERIQEQLMGDSGVKIIRNNIMLQSEDQNEMMLLIEESYDGSRCL